jgi:hypothetical protein
MVKCLKSQEFCQNQKENGLMDGWMDVDNAELGFTGFTGFTGFPGFPGLGNQCILKPKVTLGNHSSRVHPTAECVEKVLS